MITPRDYRRYAALRREGYSAQQAVTWMRYMRRLDTRWTAIAASFNEGMRQFGLALRPAIAKLAAASRALEESRKQTKRIERLQAAAMQDYGRRKGRNKWR